MPQCDGFAFSETGSIQAFQKRELLYLSKVSFLEDRHEILAEFSGSFSKLVKRFKFFPFFYLPSSFDRTQVQELVLSLGFKGFSIEEENGFLKLRSLSFFELKKISNALALHLNRLPVVLSPERGFLLEKNWSFFDAFEEVDGLLFKFSPSSSASGWERFDFGFFLTKEFSFKEALRICEQDTMFLVELSAWSYLLSVPINEVPSSVEEKLELFLENVFFKHGEPLLFEQSEKVFSNSGFEPLSRNEVLSKIDFSMVWAELFSNNFFNIGPETRNCSCCMPLTLDSKNLLPSSLIRVRFLEDNFFFESSSGSFALDFHESNALKELRIQKRKEFFTESFPIGPFFKNDSSKVPLLDAKRLISDGNAVLVSSHAFNAFVESEPGSVFPPKIGSFACVSQSNVFSDLHSVNWFCLNKESFFSQEVREANSKLFELSKSFVFSDSSLSSVRGFGFFYSKALHQALNNLLVGLPLQLTNPNSKFFSTQLAKSIVSIQEATIAKFKEFSEKEGYRVLHANKNSAFVKGFSSLKLAKSFSEQTKLPQPQIAGFSTKTKKGFS